ncbi:hypothetical protein [Acinetobacter pollinis]|nr:hypothetical protein [Acinetobacter pollinis]MBF7689940.1 hypothetical protein [Acinetobacter pollinis]MBF7697411.1 hypothetical protein [Acinetobacter pollinis]
MSLFICYPFGAKLPNIIQIALLLHQKCAFIQMNSYLMNQNKDSDPV